MIGVIRATALPCTNLLKIGSVAFVAGFVVAAPRGEGHYPPRLNLLGNEFRLPAGILVYVDADQILR